MAARQFAIGIGIALVFPLLAYNGIAALYPPPRLPAAIVATLVTPKDEAARQHQQAEVQRIERRTQEVEFAARAKDFARILAFVSTPLGLAAILVGLSLRPPAIASGLIFGGIITIAWGYFRYWPYLDDWIRWLGIGIGVAVLAIIGRRHIAGGPPRSNA